MTEKLTEYGRIKSRVFEILEDPPGGDRESLLVQVTIGMVVILNTVAVVIFTIPSVEASWSTLLNAVITFCLVVFAIEYLLRIWSCTDAGTWQERMSERFRYATSFYLIIDLLSIIPCCSHILCLRLCPPPGVPPHLDLQAWQVCPKIEVTSSPEARGVEETGNFHHHGLFPGLCHPLFGHYHVPRGKPRPAG